MYPNVLIEIIFTKGFSARLGFDTVVYEAVPMHIIMLSVGITN